MRCYYNNSMSLNNISDTFIPNTLSGLESINATNITINGVDVNTLFVPYAGANTNIDLNAKNLSGVNALNASTVTSSGLVQGQNLTATGLTSSNTLTTTGLATLQSVRVAGIAAGTAVNKVGVTSGGLLISTPLASQPDVTTTTSNINYFPTLVQYSGTAQPIYVDDTNPSIALRYNPSTSTLYAYVSVIPTLTTATSFTALGTNNIAGYATLLSPAFSGYPTAPTQPTVDNSTNLATTAYVNNVLAATPISQPTVTGTQTNTTYSVMFAPNSSTTPNSALYVDSGGHLIYNPNTNTLYTSFLEVSQITSNCTFTAIVSGATAAPGTNTTQLATTAFVTAAVAGYLTKTGTQTGINTTLQLLNATSLFKVEGATVRTYLCVDSALDRVEIGELRVLYGTTCQGGLGVGNIIQVYGSSNPLIDFGATTAIGKATAATGLISDSGASDLCVINYNTDIRFAARQNVTTNMLISNTEVVVYNALRTNNGASFRIAGNQLAGYNNIGLFADNAGFFTNHVGALTAGLTGTNAGDLVLYANASGEMKFYTGNTRAITLNFNGMVVTRQYLHLNNANSPYLNITPDGGAGNYFAQATASGAFISGSEIGDLCINSRTGNIRLAGSQFARTNMLLTNSGISCQASSMFDFSTGSAGGWTDSNSLHITTGGLGGNNAGVGIGFSTTLDSGLLCSIAPNVIWKPMTYKAAGHIFTNLNIPIVGINAVGVYAYSAGYLASYGQANSAGAGLTGGSAGDLILYANNSNTLRIYAGLTQVSAFGTYAGAPLQLWKGNPVWYIEGTAVNIFINTAQVGYWDRGVGGSAWRIKSQEQLQIGGADGNIFHNFVTPPQDNNPFGPSSWDGGCLFTNTFGNSSFQQGFNIVYNETYGYTFLTSLQPSVAWKGLTISAGQTEVYFYGGFCSYTTSGGWVNVSDEREKEDIKLLKTNRSLERVLSAKTYSYKRKYYLNDKGKDLTPTEVRDKVLVGVMAQQIQESNPHCISSWKSNEAHEERFGVCYNDYVVHLLGAVQEQQTQITSQQASIDLLIKHLTDLTNQVNELTKKINLV